MGKLKIAVVGLGIISKQHIDAISNSEKLELVAVCDISKEAREKFEKEQGLPAFATISELCSKLDCDIIDICTPTFAHKECIFEACENKKHIFCEKPISLIYDEIAEIQDVVEKAGVKFMLGQVLRSWPEYMEIKKLYDSGKFGVVKLTSQRRICELYKQDHWLKDGKLSGGALFDLILHDIDFACYTFGEAKSVYASGYYTEKFNSWNNIAITINFKNGITSMFEACEEVLDHYPFTAGMRINGSDLTLNYELKGGSNINDPMVGEVHLYEAGKEAKLMEIEQFNAFQEELDYFANCVANGSAVERCTFASIDNTMKTMHAIKKSLETGKIIEIFSK